MRALSKSLAFVLAVVIMIGTVPIIIMAEGAEAYIEIHNVSDLKRISSEPAGKYMLMSDLDLSDTDWTPFAFSGTLDGKGKSINGLKIDISIMSGSTQSIGLFSACNGATIRNLKIVNCALVLNLVAGSLGNPNVYIGSFAGSASNSTFIGCSCTGNISVTTNNDNSSYAGGLVGFANSTSFNSCYNSATVSASVTTIIGTARAGGICGELGQPCVVSNCFNTGSVSAASESESTYAGGIVAINYGTITKSYNAGNISACGGSMSLCDIFAGGIVAKGESNSTVTNCAVMSGEITLPTIGYVSNNSKSIIANGGSKSNNISLNGIGGSPVNDANTSYSALQLTELTPYLEIGWDFEEIWDFVSGFSYPQLREIDAGFADDMAAVNRVCSELFIQFSVNFDYYDRVTGNVILPTDTEYGASVSWSSSDTQTITTEGIVTRQQENQLVTMTALISKGDYSAKKAFYLTVIKIPETAPATPQVGLLSVDDARSYVALIEGKEFSEVPADHPGVGVLIGVDESNKANFIDIIMKSIDFLEVDFDKLNANQTRDDLKNSLNEMTVGYCLGIIETLIPMASGGVALYGVIDSFSDISIINTVDAFSTAASEVCRFIGEAAWGETIGMVSNVILLCETTTLAINVAEDAMMKYINTYIEARENYDSKDDEIFVFFMDSYAVYNHVANVNKEQLNMRAEGLYQLRQRLKRTQSYYRIEIQCPVDVSVYNEAGNIVGSVVNNQIDYSINNSVKIDLDGDSKDIKILSLPVDEDYTIRLCGNGTGKMNILFNAIRQNGCCSHAADFSQIALSDGSDMILSIPSYGSIDSKESIELFVLDRGSQHECVKSTIVNTEYNISIIAQGGVASGEGKYLKNQAVVLSATAVNGFDFVGWYENGDLIDGAGPLYVFMADSSRVLEARFEPSESLTDEEIVSADKALLNWNTIKNGNSHQNSVTGDLNLITNGVAGSTVSWSSTNEQVISSTGIVCRPVFPASDTAVTLVATIRRGNANETVEFSITVLRHAISSNGVCGSNLIWSFNEDGKLLISGTGAMSSYSLQEVAPWSAYAELITNVQLFSGVTSIGAYAFFGLLNVAEITVPNSVKSFGDSAFGACKGLSDVYYAGNQSDYSNLTIAAGNEFLIEAIWHLNIDEHKHSYKTVEAIDATCTEQGSVTYKCECGYSYTVSSVALNHDLVHHDAKIATCTNGGWAAYDTCLRCDYTTYAEIPAQGHSFIHHNARTASCTKFGWVEYDSCSRGDYSTYVEIPALGHNLIHHSEKPASCTDKGWAAYDTCSECDYTTISEIPARGHRYVVRQIEPTYEFAGKKYKECLDCHGIIDEVVLPKLIVPIVFIENNSGTQTINYGERLKLTATVTDVSVDTAIVWYINGIEKGRGEVFITPVETSDFSVMVKLVNASDVTIKDASGNEIAAEENVKVNAGFLRKLINFFMSIFGASRIVTQEARKHC